MVCNNYNYNDKMVVDDINQVRYFQISSIT